jgi:hypothetical protein
MDGPNSFYVTFTIDNQIVGYMTIDRETFAVVPKVNTLKLAREDLESVVKDLRTGKVAGQFGQTGWHEGPAKGADSPEDSKSNW